MKNTVLGSVVAATLWVVAPFAQQQPAPTSKATPAPATPAHNVFVLTGCLKAGADATAAFKLTDASSIGHPTPAAAGEAGAIGTSGQKPSYELRPVSGVGAQGVNADALKAQVGQRVEVIVRPIESPAAAPTAGLAAAQAAKPIEPAPERFSVTEIKRVIGTCSE
jgi:hypothetical protein